jgi:hypothetical protein
MLDFQSREVFMGYVKDCFTVDEMFNELVEEAKCETEDDFLKVEEILSEKLEITQDVLHEALLLTEIMRSGSAGGEEIEAIPVG